MHRLRHCPIREGTNGHGKCIIKPLHHAYFSLSLSLSHSPFLFFFVSSYAAPAIRYNHVRMPSCRFMCKITPIANLIGFALSVHDSIGNLPNCFSRRSFNWSWRNENHRRQKSGIAKCRFVREEKNQKQETMWLWSIHHKPSWKSTPLAPKRSAFDTLKYENGMLLLLLEWESPNLQGSDWLGAQLVASGCPRAKKGAVFMLCRPNYRPGSPWHNSQSCMKSKEQKAKSEIMLIDAFLILLLTLLSKSMILNVLFVFVFAEWHHIPESITRQKKAPWLHKQCHNAVKKIQFEKHRLRVSWRKNSVKKQNHLSTSLLTVVPPTHSIHYIYIEQEQEKPTNFCLISFRLLFFIFYFL